MKTRERIETDRYRENHLLNVVKCIMAICILALHVTALGPYSKFAYPLYRCAVPYFFVVGSYFFFKKYNSCSNKNNAIKNYVKRNLQLYIFWFLVSLPVCIRIKRYIFFDERGVLYVLKKWIIAVLFGSTWMASWYIQATIIGTLLVLLLSRIFKPRTVIIVGLFCYAICCLSSNYLGMFSEDNVLYKLNSVTSITGTFLASLLWIAIGKWFADGNKIGLRYHVKIALILISFLGVVLENICTIYLDFQITSDAFFLLIPLIWVGTDIIIHYDNRNSVRNEKILRNFSTLLYCSQCILIPVVTASFNALFKMESKKNWWIFVFILFINIMMTIIISRLEKNKFFRFLKYSH